MYVSSKLKWGFFFHVIPYVANLCIGGKNTSVSICFNQLFIIGYFHLYFDQICE